MDEMVVGYEGPYVATILQDCSYWRIKITKTKPAHIFDTELEEWRSEKPTVISDRNRDHYITRHYYQRKPESKSIVSTSKCTGLFKFWRAKRRSTKMLRKISATDRTFEWEQYRDQLRILEEAMKELDEI